MTFTFLGTGTSTGVPMVGCACAVCRSTDPHNRRRRCSVLISRGSSRWLIDAGPDFRDQALSVGLQHLDAVLLTHAHSDHILGLDDLRPLSWKMEIPVWSDEPTEVVVRKAFPYFFEPGDGKTSRPKLSFHRIGVGTTFDASGLRVVPLAIQHGDVQILGFRVGDFAYLTDCNGIPEQTMPLLTGLKVLVLDALRVKPHATHFGRDQAVEVARRVGATQTFLTHFSHDVDHATWVKELPPGIAPAHDGLILELADPL